MQDNCIGLLLNSSFDKRAHVMSLLFVVTNVCRSTAREFVVPKLPWLLEAMGSAVLDFSIVCQVIYYKRKNRDWPEVAALIPAAGPATFL